VTRVYVATTPDGLDRFRATGSLAEGERFTAPEEGEEAEYAALMAAADASGALDPRGGRRVVVVAEVPDENAEVGRADVVAVHLDTADRDAEADPDDDLEWFDPSELDHL
jgi:hypothetical protein